MAGNGAGGFYASQVLKPLGADVSGSQFLEPDGRFPNHIPNPENEDAMASVCSAVLEAKADLGIIFDTDVDRAGCVDAAGREINRNRLVALASAIVLEQYPGGTVVTDSITSDGLKVFIERCPRGTLPLQTRLPQRDRRGHPPESGGCLCTARDRNLRPCRGEGQLFPRRRRLSDDAGGYQSHAAAQRGKDY